jgi:hypothetical protein
MRRYSYRPPIGMISLASATVNKNGILIGLSESEKTRFGKQESVSDCLSPVVARDYLRCSVLFADGSITSKGVKFKVTHYSVPKRGSVPWQTRKTGRAGSASVMTLILPFHCGRPFSFRLPRLHRERLSNQDPLECCAVPQSQPTPGTES